MSLPGKSQHNHLRLSRLLHNIFRNQCFGFLDVFSSLGCSSHFFHNLHNSLIAISYALFSDLPASRFQTLSAIHIHSITRKTRGPYTSFSHPFTSRTACNVVIFRLQLRSVTCYTWLLCLSFTWAPSRCFISVTR